MCIWVLSKQFLSCAHGFNVQSYFDRFCHSTGFADLDEHTGLESVINPEDVCLIPVGHGNYHLGLHAFWPLQALDSLDILTSAKDIGDPEDLVVVIDQYQVRFACMRVNMHACPVNSGADHELRVSQQDCVWLALAH